MSTLQVKTVTVNPMLGAVIKPDAGYAGLSQVEAQSTWRGAWSCAFVSEPYEFSSRDGDGIVCLPLDSSFSDALNIPDFEDWRVFRPLIERVKGTGRLAITPWNSYDYEDDYGDLWAVVNSGQTWILDGVWTASSTQGRDVLNHLPQPGLTYRNALNVFRFFYRPKMLDAPVAVRPYAAYFASLPDDPASLWLLGVMRLDDQQIILDSAAARDVFMDAEVTLTVDTDAL